MGDLKSILESRRAHLFFFVATIVAAALLGAFVSSDLSTSLEPREMLIAQLGIGACLCVIAGTGALLWTGRPRKPAPSLNVNRIETASPAEISVLLRFVGAHSRQMRLDEADLSVASLVGAGLIHQRTIRSIEDQINDIDPSFEIDEKVYQYVHEHQEQLFERRVRPFLKS